MQDFHDALAPISRFVATLDLDKTHEAEAALTQAFPPSGDAVERLKTLAVEALKDGKICFRGEPGMTFSRVLKPEVDAGGCSVDAVHMTDTQGPVHTHLKGEVCLCIPMKDSPSFEGRSATWMVLPPGSRHRPTVTGGTMLILYWWPAGAVAWE